MQLDVGGQRGFVYTGNRPLRADAPTLLFVHGAAMDHSVWLLQSRYFAHRGYNVLAVDLPGHGRAGGAPLRSIEAIADWLPRLLDAAGVARAALIGHSMGSLAVLETAARHPQRVERLALLGSSLPMPVAQPLLNAAQHDLAGAIDMVTIWANSPDAHFGANPAPGVWLVGATRRLLERAPPGLLYNDLNACNEYRHGLDSAAAVAAPALCLLGSADRMTPPRAARALIDALGETTQVQTLERCGHMMMMEQPDPVLGALRHFLNAGSAH